VCRGPKKSTSRLSPLRAAVLFGVLVFLAPPVVGGAQLEQKRVLVLHSTGRDAMLASLTDQNLQRLLSREHHNIDYYVEYLDAGRFQQARHAPALRAFLRTKYAGLQFDLVVAMLDPAIQFAAANRDELFPGVPVVFLTRTPTRSRLPNSTGFIFELDFTQTLALATALQPDITDVFVVSGASARDKALEAQARTQFRSLDNRLTFTFLTGLPSADLERRLASLPPRSIVYYVLMYEDGNGSRFQPLDYLDRIAPRTNRPIYSWVDSAMGRGVVGGSLRQLTEEIQATADLALRVLRGEPADSIPVSWLRAARREVDWRQLRRWGIDEARIPPDTIVHSRQIGVWERYRVYIIAATMVGLLQSTLILRLLFQAARRRRVELALLHNQEALLASSNRVRALGRRLLHAQEDERSRIARELHDDVGQQLMILMIDLHQLADTSRDARAPPDLVDDALNRLQNIATTVRDLSHNLHPVKLRLVGLPAALDALRREVSHSGVSISVSSADVPARLTEELSLCLYRVAQEALNNAIKHGAARTISMRLSGRPGAVSLTIIDDGVGFDWKTEWRKGLGLNSMHERVESIGGTLTIRSRRGAGTRLRAEVPLSLSPATAVTDPGSAAAGRASHASAGAAGGRGRRAGGQG
jgi:signal transduction histidine kinase